MAMDKKMDNPPKKMDPTLDDIIFDNLHYLCQNTTNLDRIIETLRDPTVGKLGEQDEAHIRSPKDDYLKIATMYTWVRKSPMDYAQVVKAISSGENTEVVEFLDQKWTSAAEEKEKKIQEDLKKKSSYSTPSQSYAGSNIGFIVNGPDAKVNVGKYINKN